MHQPVNRPLGLALITLTSFVVSANLGVVAPLIVDMSRDLGVSVPVIAQLTTITSFSWAALSPFIGSMTDRFGRKPAMSLGLAVAGLSCVACAFASDYFSLFGFRLLVGLGAGAVAPTTSAAIGDLFRPHERGRAMSVLHVGIILGILVAVALLTFEAQMLGWRASFLTLGSFTLLAALLMTSLYPTVAITPRTEPFLANIRSTLKSPGVLHFLTANVLHESSYAIIMAYLPAYLILIYGLSTGQVAPLVSIVAAGTLIGNLIGGQMADRGWRVRLCIGAPTFLGLFALVLFSVSPGITLSIALAVLAVFFWGLARPSYSAFATQLSERSHGAMMGINSTSNQLGDAIGPALGGLLLVTFGYGAMGIATIALGLAATVVARTLLRLHAAQLTNTSHAPDHEANGHT